MPVCFKLLQRVVDGFGILMLLSAIAVIGHAQSTEISSPSPVISNDVVGTIPVRDLGDARLTDHYYAFTGTPGDVLITITSKNLNGDVDVFTAGSLRPLLKFALYAESSSPATKGIYLRRREDLILRIEARSPNDDEGSYQIRFGGSFEAMPQSLIADSANPTAAESARIVKKGRRVSSVGARINEPNPPETVATAPPAEPSATPEETAKANPTLAATEEPVVARPKPVRRGRARVPAARRSPPQPAKTTEPTDADSKAKENADEATATETPARPARSGRRGARETAAAPDEAEAQTGPRLILEMVDGTRIERYMSSVRRVTVENNQIVVVRRDGRIERTRMGEVLKMTIEP
ncbi:MAG: hypothetical protein ABJB97_10490 [Acidobacteriota bacterium]